jgi:type IV fimbrial biogenesis protein FimT
VLNVSTSTRTITDALGRGRGFSLVEMMVVITILAMLLLAGGGSFSTWIANGKVRSVAEDLANGLRIAQSESMRRNRVVALAVTTATPALNAAPSTRGVNWYVESLARTSDATTTAIYIQGGNYGTQSGIAVAASSALVCFGPLGNQVDLSASSTINAIGTACAAGSQSYTISHSSADKTLKVLLSAGGQVRICDTAKTLSSSNPDGCPSS